MPSVGRRLEGSNRHLVVLLLDAFHATVLRGLANLMQWMPLFAVILLTYKRCIGAEYSLQLETTGRSCCNSGVVGLYKLEIFHFRPICPPLHLSPMSPDPNTKGNQRKPTLCFPLCWSSGSEQPCSDSKLVPTWFARCSRRSPQSKRQQSVHLLPTCS